ncbi:hypothetical protein HHI36_004494 [Cryptolaemus montrouzieri]|uniref:Uncharacterized protein n=1 Tax=Cryptolaemus montrouzieri TaxID=559131 RepID=A0ABD2NRD6_9CUCU
MSVKTLDFSYINYKPSPDIRSAGKCKGLWQRLQQWERLLRVIARLLEFVVPYGRQRQQTMQFETLKEQSPPLRGDPTSPSPSHSREEGRSDDNITVYSNEERI